MKTYFKIIFSSLRNGDIAALLLNIVFFSILLYLTLDLGTDWSLWCVIGDAFDYVHQSRYYSVFEKGFYFPESITGFFYPRPFTVPLIYKMAGSGWDSVVRWQQVLHCVSAFFLAASVSKFVKTNWVKICVILFIYLFMSWWNVVGWTKIVLSESLSMTMFFAWISTLLFLIRSQSKYILLVHAFIAVLFAGTRDTWPYVILLFYLLMLGLRLLFTRKLSKKYLFLFVMSVAVFFIQQKSADVGQRYRLPLINTIVMRIVPEKDYVNWFVKEGMPCSDSLVKNFTVYDRDSRNWIKIYGLYTNKNYSPLWRWVTTKGKTAYMKFLLTHPEYTFLLKEPEKKTERIFAMNLDQVREPVGFTKLSHKLFPVFTIWSFCFVIVLLLFAFFRVRTEIYLSLIVLTLTMTFNVFLTYNADALEMERHLFITNVYIQLSGIIISAFLLDRIPELKQRFAKNKSVTV